MQLYKEQFPPHSTRRVCTLTSMLNPRSSPNGSARNHLDRLSAWSDPEIYKHLVLKRKRRTRPEHGQQHMNWTHAFRQQRSMPQSIARSSLTRDHKVANAKERGTRQSHKGMPPAPPPETTRTTRPCHKDLVFEAMAVTEGTNIQSHWRRVLMPQNSLPVKITSQCEVHK